jgi:hypothetical protein
MHPRGGFYRTSTMTTPSTTIYVRPAWGSYTWTYAGATMLSGAGSMAVTAVAFDVASVGGQQLSRGMLQYSVDRGTTWLSYAAPVDGEGAYVQAAGTVWRFLDRSGGDNTTVNTFSVHYRLADGSVVSAENTVLVDNPPASLVGENSTMFSTLQAGAVVDLLSPIDSGSMTDGRWVIDSQSQPGLFAIAYNPALDTGARLVIADPSQLPVIGLGAAVTIHYYDRYQLDTSGNPIAGQGVIRTLSYTVEDGATHDLAGFGDEAQLGAASGAYAGSPSLAALSGGGFVAVWQGSDTVAGSAGAGLWAQLRDAGGAAGGPAFALTPNGDAKAEGEPAVAALGGGRFVVAYALVDPLIDGGASRVAYRVVEANGSAGAEHVLDAGVSAGGDNPATMPAIATLADGSFAVGWRSGGAVHVQQAAAADGSPVGAEQVYTALASAYSPSIAALKGGGYVVSWGEINDGNVYAATNGANGAGGAGAPFIVNGDGLAASLMTAAPLPHVTTLANGNVVVAWDSYANAPLGFTICDIFFQVLDRDGHALGGPVQANIESGGGRYDAAVTALSDGGFVVAWQSQTGDFEGSGIFGRRFGADGSAVDLQEFEINQMRAGDQTSPGLAALANGGFAAAWVDTPAGGGVSVEARVFAVASTLLEGTAGLDTVVFGSERLDYALANDGAHYSVYDFTGGSKTLLANVERLQFSDQNVALDIHGNAGEAYRLYQAAFNRTPDKVGLGFWIDALDKGYSLMEAAAGFVNSAEFASLYGANASDTQFVQALYQNVLHRMPDAGGSDFWVHALEVTSRAEVLIGFSESGENQAQVIGAIENGIGYTPWV